MWTRTPIGLAVVRRRAVNAVAEEPLDVDLAPAELDCDLRLAHVVEEAQLDDPTLAVARQHGEQARQHSAGLAAPVSYEVPYEEVGAGRNRYTRGKECMVVCPIVARSPAHSEDWGSLDAD
jgi:hypothetical protein